MRLFSLLNAPIFIVAKKDRSDAREQASIAAPHHRLLLPFGLPLLFPPRFCFIIVKTIKGFVFVFIFLMPLTFFS